MKEAWKAAKQIEYQRAKRDLLTKRDNAVSEGDSDGVVAIEAKMDELEDKLIKDVAKPPEKKPEQSPVDPYFAEWVKDNQWYANDPALQREADGYFEYLKTTGRVGSFKNNGELLNNVAEYVKRGAPDRFPEHKPPAPPKVGKTTRGSGEDVGVDADGLPEEYRDALKQYKLMGKTKEELKAYVKEWKKMGV